VGFNHYIKLNEKDNVAITVSAISSGTIVLDGICANEDIPQGHKIALRDLSAGEAIIRYGVTLGYALHPIKKVIGLMNICFNFHHRLP
jgi:galactarate dehydratase